MERYAPVGLPEEAQAFLLIEVDGDADCIAGPMERVRQVCVENSALQIRLAREKAEQEELWRARRAVSPALRNISPYKMNEDIVVPRSRIPEIIDSIQQTARRYDLPIVNFGHAGDGNIHVNVMGGPGGEADVPKMERAVVDIFQATVKLGGRISGEHGIGLAKQPYIGLNLDAPTLALSRQLKRTLDPRQHSQSRKDISPGSRFRSCFLNGPAIRSGTFVSEIYDSSDISDIKVDAVNSMQFILTGETVETRWIHSGLERWRQWERRFMPAHVWDSDPLTFWRERILFFIAFTSSVLGLVALIPSLILALLEGRWNIILLDTSAYLTALAALLGRRFPLKVRAWIVCLMLYLLGDGLMFMLGPHRCGVHLAFRGLGDHGGHFGIQGRRMVAGAQPDFPRGGRILYRLRPPELAAVRGKSPRKMDHHDHQFHDDQYAGGHDDRFDR